MKEKPLLEILVWLMDSVPSPVGLGLPLCVLLSLVVNGFGSSSVLSKTNSRRTTQTAQ
jgi:hypothetical protein